jgi:arylsulfatase A-like enzyme
LSRSHTERDVLPIPDRPYDGPVPLTRRIPDAKFPPIEQLRPPDGAPNVLVILLDDVGFAASSAFGGPCATPTAERLAGQGLKYNRFHTTALCAPTRQALLTGRNHHTVGMGVITELATSAPGYNSIRPNTCAPLAQTLLLNGYSTAQFGKCHEVPVWQSSPMGPFDAWPTGRRWVRVLLRLHRRRDEPVLPRDLRGHDGGGAREDPGGGLPLHGGHDRQVDQVGPPAEVAHARQALLHVLRSRSRPRPAPCADRVVGQVQGSLRRRLGHVARGDPRAPEGARRRSRGRRAHRAARGDPCLG